ncbi:hypothetical protein PC129_g19913 [Phytophthora cactorum]|uniref:RXLR phytopathogen effector protein WY-domain domain-containing protein n=1 Tax=Phytophthora cactorum TaxID=29920 RepID=A0A329RAK0_9STRA|nr:hypothetical protein Pcac1_g17037 [Phytophthora cactorum]KAG2799714.1 hypothetical protein PC112_g20783 [Phytophthora cactorum]KAG2799803.1 hypothetical protein PC111_g20264 [Phytophthora cactorum]KAG2832582.1 hypothetical protein PC113_g20719 [Phytophthora cactorum]KAG2884276.1 hypothetical protein PC114_g20184 [Phytophthora cactorum]
MYRPAVKKLTLGEQLKVRIGDHGYVFKTLGLNGGLTNPKLHLYTWFNEKTHTNKVTMLGMFSKTYGDDGVARMIEIGRKSSSMDTKKIASRLLGGLPMKVENRMVNQWLKKGNPPEAIFELLQLNKGLDDILTNPNLMMWEGYRIKFDSIPDEDVFTIMQTRSRVSTVSRMRLIW